MKRVFLAEDDATMVRLLETLLKIEGFEVQPIDLAKGKNLKCGTIGEAQILQKPFCLMVNPHSYPHRGVYWYIIRVRDERIIMAQGRVIGRGLLVTCGLLLLSSAARRSE